MNEHRASALGRALGAVFRHEEEPESRGAPYALWLTWGLLATSGSALLDFALGMSAFGFRSFASVFGLSLLVGALLGLGLASLTLLGRRWRGVASAVPWAVFGVVVWLLLCRSLEVWANLTEKHRDDEDTANLAIHIPLFVQAAGLAPGTRSELTSIVDVFPTILALTETPAPKHIDGASLTEPVGDRTLFVDTFVCDEEGTGLKADHASEEDALEPPSVVPCSVLPLRASRWRG